MNLAVLEFETLDQLLALYLLPLTTLQSYAGDVRDSSFNEDGNLNISGE
jgi:hypothetical protein